MNLDSHYAVPAGTKFRDEDFGGVVYQRTGDRIHFITSRLAVRLLSLAGTGTVREIAARIAAGSINENEQVIREHILKTLGYFEELGIVHELEHRDNAAESAHMPDLADHKQV